MLLVKNLNFLVSLFLGNINKTTDVLNRKEAF